MTWDDRVETSFDTWHDRYGDDYIRIEQATASTLRGKAFVVVERRGDRQPVVSVDVPGWMRGTDLLEALCEAAWRRLDEEHAAIRVG